MKGKIGTTNLTEQTLMVPILKWWIAYDKVEVECLEPRTDKQAQHDYKNT